MARLNPLLDRLPGYFADELYRIKAELQASGIPVYDFSVGDPIEPAPAFVADAARAAITESLPYPRIQGSREVRQAIADYLLRRFGVKVDPETQVLPSSGSKEAVFHTPLLVIDPDAPDKKVIFPDPGYPAYQRGALFAGADAHAVILEGDFVFRPWELEEEVLRNTRMMWVNTPHNPSGAMNSLEDLKRMCELAVEYDFLLVSDETYADIYQDIVPHSILQAGLTNVVALHSLSKRSGMTGYRSAFLAGDPFWIKRLAELRSNPGLAPQDFINAAAAAAWADDEHVAERRAIFRAKKDVLMAFFAEAGFEVVGSDATIYIWIKVPPGEGSDEDWCKKLMRKGIILSPGRMYGVAGGGQGYARVAMVPDLQTTRAAVEAWRELL